jgi:hypothetical protein
MDTYWTTATGVTYWSVTSNIVLNSRMTNSPTVFGVTILIGSPSCLLFHILSSAIVSLGMQDLYLLSSTCVMGHFTSWSIVAYSRVCVTQVKHRGEFFSLSPNPRESWRRVRCLWYWTYVSHMSVGKVSLTLVLMDIYIIRIMLMDHYMKLSLTKYEDTSQTIIIVPLNLSVWCLLLLVRVQCEFVCLLFFNVNLCAFYFCSFNVNLCVFYLPVDSSTCSVWCPPHNSNPKSATSSPWL